MKRINKELIILYPFNNLSLNEKSNNVLKITFNHLFRINLIVSDRVRFVENIFFEIFREFVSQPNAGLGIHKDGTPEFPKYLALNWPVENCEGTRMLWWELNKDAQVAIDTVDVAFKSNNSLKFYSESDAVKVGEFEIVKPTLVNVGAYHSVVNGPNIRRMVSFRFKPEPLHLL